MMTISEITKYLESIAPLSFQESYDNAGLIVGNANWQVKNVLCSLDATEEVVMEAVGLGCNLIVAHHPIVFSGMKKLNGKNYVERAVIAAIKNDVAIYAIHTNLDNVHVGVSKEICDRLGLQNCQVLDAKQGLLMKLITFVPTAHLEKVRDALFVAGAGNIGNYSEASFASAGTGTFKAGEDTNAFVGEKGNRHYEPESKLEVIFPAHLQFSIVSALQSAHPYEEVAYDLVPLANIHQQVGSGMIGELPTPVQETEFLAQLKTAFGLKAIRHTPLLNKMVKKVAVCGGAGSFLNKRAMQAGADFYVTADVKYHEFFDADGQLVLADIGHWESEQFTVDLLMRFLQQKFPTFATFKTRVITNPVNYYI
jgi:dinuclear metal center YbgI/SA1388 family protein